MRNEINHSEVARIKELLLGHRVVEAKEGTYKDSWAKDAAAVLTLDDGTVLHVVPNQGGCACSAGDYYLTAFNTCDNIITDVQVVEDVAPKMDGNYAYEDTVYRISVFAGDEQINLVEMEGDDGNGYYGTGFQIYVTAPS